MNKKKLRSNWVTRTLCVLGVSATLLLGGLTPVYAEEDPSPAMVEAVDESAQEQVNASELPEEPVVDSTYEALEDQNSEDTQSVSEPQSTEVEVESSDPTLETENEQDILQNEALDMDVEDAEEAEKNMVGESPKRTPSIVYSTHIQKIGWQASVSNGGVSGTSGRSLRLEGIRIALQDNDYGGDVLYRTHIQRIGWESSFRSGNQVSGTSGQSLRLEAIQIQLAGEIANHYDVYYRVHCQKLGWMGWAKNGELSGSAGYSYRLEAIQIVLTPKNGAAPGPTANHFAHSLVKYQTHVQSYGWQNTVADGAVSGTTGQSKRLEGIKITLNNQEYDGDIQYQTHIQSIGWQNWVSNGMLSGTTGMSKRLEAIRIQLTGTMASYYDVYYRVHAQRFGWMGWAKNGEAAGTEGYSYRLEGIQIVLVGKGGAAPGDTNQAYAKYENPYATLSQGSSGKQISTFGGYAMSASARSKVESAINSLKNYNCGFLLVDINTGKGISYNPDQTFFSASTIKGPYVASLVANKPETIQNDRNDILNVLRNSDNDAYSRLVRKYGQSYLKAWAKDSGAGNITYSTDEYAFYSPRQLAQMWQKMYEFFNTANGQSVAGWYQNPNESAIKATAGRTHTTRTKGGWNTIPGAPKYDSTSDAGIVYAGGSPYVVAIMSNYPEDMSKINALASALEQVHSEM